MQQQYTKTKGDSYESFILKYLISNGYEAWSFKTTPEKIIAKTNLYKKYDIYNKYRYSDIGADIVAHKNDTVYFIQCKNFNGTISINDICSFYYILHEHELNGIFCYNGTLSERLTDLSGNKVQFINVPYNNNLIDTTFNIKQNIILPKDYQFEAYIKLHKQNRSVLNLPCGMGKTYISYLISKKYDNVIIISPLRALAIEQLTKISNYYYNEYYNDINPILISMDGSRDINEILKIIKDKNIVSVTYDSVDILNLLLPLLTNVFIVIDEYHNLSLNNLTNNDDEINKILMSDKKILYLSATPLIFKSDKYITEELQLQIFGKSKYRYSWSKAIKNKYICDFDIILPNKDIDISVFDKLLEELEVYSKELVSKCYFLLKSLLYDGSRKCIVYLTDIEQLNKFKETLIWMQTLLNMRINIYDIDYNTKKCKRMEYIYNFTNDEDISLLLNVQILNEGIDIPVCDSVYITSPGDNIINLVQRMCRCNRIYEDKTTCKIYMWCNDGKVSKILDYLNDSTEGEFNKKIVTYNLINSMITNNDKIQMNINDDKNRKEINITIKIISILSKTNINRSIFWCIDKNKLIWISYRDLLICMGYKDIDHIMINMNIVTKNIDNYRSLNVIYNNTNKCVNKNLKLINTYGLFELIKKSTKHISDELMKLIIDELLIE